MIVRVYWNLHKDCWSIQHKRIVIGHASSVLLKDVKFMVSEASRQRVIRDKRKNVHAYAQGTILSVVEKPLNLTVAVTYNPYKFGWFYIKNNQTPIYTSSLVYCGFKELLIGEP